MSGCNSFVLFCKDYRKSLLSHNPDKSNSEITSILGYMWRNLDFETKQKYKRTSSEMRDVSEYKNFFKS